MIFYNHGRQTLRDLDPKNPQLLSLSTREWVPTQEDINVINREIYKVRRQRSLIDLERHHDLPRQFKREFGDIDIENFIRYLYFRQHRQKDTGLQSGPYPWNREWKDFWEERPEATPDQILEQLLNMLPPRRRSPRD
jgi:hypothetical protein